MVLEKMTAKAKVAGFTQGQEDRLDFFQELLGLLAPKEFQREGFFNAWVRYVKDRCQAAEAGQDPNEVVFPYDLSDDDDDPEHSSGIVPIEGDGEGAVMKILISKPAQDSRPSFSILLCSFSFSY